MKYVHRIAFLALLCGCSAPSCPVPDASEPDASAPDAGPPVRAAACDELDAFAAGLACPTFCPWVAPCESSDVAPCMELLRLQADTCRNLAVALGDDLCRVCR